MGVATAMPGSAWQVSPTNQHEYSAPLDRRTSSTAKVGDVASQSSRAPTCFGQLLLLCIRWRGERALDKGNQR
jgi:hypothetical protein